MKKKARILVIDDDDNIRKVLASILEEKGYEADVAKNGEEAIEKSRKSFYNLALIDIRLPDMKGTELLTRLKQTTPKMVKIILTGYPSMDNAIDAVDKGADGYLIKPVNMDVLHEKIAKHLRDQRKAKKYSEAKVAQFIETRVKQLGHTSRPR
jgi:two-component system response regulator AtoC